MQISLREDYVEASDEAQFIEWMTDAAMQKWPCIDEGKIELTKQRTMHVVD